MGQQPPARHHGRTLLHQAVADSLRRDIEAGFYPRGTYLPSEAELCARFSVSRGTLRQALGTLARMGLLRAEAGIGHRVGGSLVSRGHSADGLVAVVAPYSGASPYLAEMVAGLERTLSGAGLRLIVCSTDPQPGQTSAQVQVAHLEHLLQAQPHAVVVGLADGDHPPALHRLLHAEIPVVVVGEEPADLPVDFVGTDDRLGAYMVSEWLAEWAGTAVTAVLGGPASRAVEARLDGYRLALSSRDIASDEPPILRLPACDAGVLVAPRLTVDPVYGHSAYAGRASTDQRA